MSGFRELKRKARRDLHVRMLVPAIYIPPGGGTPIPVNVRIHTKDNAAIGDMKGTSYHFAEKQEILPSILFMRNEIDAPEKNAIISVEPGEAYRIDNRLPFDDISVTVEVTRLRAAETANLPLPVTWA